MQITWLFISILLFLAGCENCESNGILRPNKTLRVGNISQDLYPSYNYSKQELKIFAKNLCPNLLFSKKNINVSQPLIYVLLFIYFYLNFMYFQNKNVALYDVEINNFSFVLYVFYMWVSTREIYKI